MHLVAGVVVVTGITGAIFVVGGASAGVFAAMWLLAAAVAAIGIAVAPRVRRPA